MLSLPRDIRFGDGSGRYLVWRAFRPLLPKGVKKNDVANEKLRFDNRLEWMRLLAEDARQGRFERACPWLHMTALRDAIRRDPPEDRIAAIKLFARIVAALRIYEMHARAGRVRYGAPVECGAPDRETRSVPYAPR